MADYRMRPGSKEKNTPGGTSEKQTSTAKKLFRQALESTRGNTERAAEKFIKKAVKKGASNFKKNTKKIKNVAKKVMEHQVAPYKAVVKKVKQIRAKSKASKAIKGSAVEGATERAQGAASKMGKTMKVGKIRKVGKVLRESKPLKKKEYLVAKSKHTKNTFKRKPVKAAASIIKPKGIVKTQMTKTTMPVSKKMMSTMTKGPKPKLKPTSRIKKVKNKETKRKKTQKVKYYKN